MNYEELFNALHPGFFRQEHIRSLPENAVFTELAMDLRESVPHMPPAACPPGITFGEYAGDFSAVQNAVRQVEEGWLPYFKPGGRVFCALDGEKIASFCLLDEMGEFRGLRIGGPGCVGTVPEYRRRGIGLAMVQRATEILRREGFDLSWIHYTHLAPWYAKLGYRPVLRWNSRGFLPERPLPQRIDHPFGPLYNENSRVLILGSFPSVKSREQNFFYGHPQNRFWRVIAALYHRPVPSSIPEKKDLILSNGLALWDSIASCEITGSSDASIRGVRANDLGVILSACPITAICCNGKASFQHYEKLIRPHTGREAICLPSTSPANAQWTLPRLTEAWSVILKL